MRLAAHECVHQYPSGMLAYDRTVTAVVGSLAGGRLAGRIPEPLLRKAFGWFVAVMGIFVLAQQLPTDLYTNPILWPAPSGSSPPGSSGFSSAAGPRVRRARPARRA